MERVIAMDEDLLTVPEVAAALKVNPETVRRWLRQKKLHGFVLGSDRGGYRIPRSEVERFLTDLRGAAGD
jgi:excisionase family DNA binding protein